MSKESWKNLKQRNSNYCQYVEGKIKCKRKAVSRYTNGLGYCNTHLQMIRYEYPMDGERENFMKEVKVKVNELQLS